MERVTDKEIAKYFNLHEQTFHRWKKERKVVYDALRFNYENKNLFTKKEIEYGIKWYLHGIPSAHLFVYYDEDEILYTKAVKIVDIIKGVNK